MDSTEHKLWMEQIGWLATIAEEFKRFNDREEAKGDSLIKRIEELEYRTDGIA